MSAPALTSDQLLALARRNTAALIAFLYLFEIFWFALSRTQIALYEPMYQVAPWDWTLVAMFVLVAGLFAGLGVLGARLARPMRRVAVAKRYVSLLVLTA
ncbi:MAG: hypothetical protein AAFX85_18975, partial [Pseudomonadota bacterium]